MIKNKLLFNNYFFKRYYKNRMKFLALVFFIIGIVYTVVGFTQLDETTKDNSKRIEYRFVPRSVYDEIGLMEVSTEYKDLFQKDEIKYDMRNVPVNLV